MFVSICTPTYNRAYTLPRLYNSLINQTDKDFEWIIVDDGSKDNTKELVEYWKNKSDFPIKYIYQKNQGKHVALNKGMQVAEGVLFTCLDSDDWFYDQTVSLTKTKWESKINERVVGIIALDTYEDGSLIGTRLPEDIQQANWLDLIYKFDMKGDKAYFFKTEIIRRFPFPEFKNNRHMPPSYQYYLVSKEYDFILFNEPLKFVEYMDDGISRNKYRKYYIAPDNFSYYRLMIMDQIPSFRRKFVNAIHFNATYRLGMKRFEKEKSKYEFWFSVTKPLGFLLSIIIEYKNKDL